MNTTWLDTATDSSATVNISFTVAAVKEIKRYLKFLSLIASVVLFMVLFLAVKTQAHPLVDDTLIDVATFSLAPAVALAIDEPLGVTEDRLFFTRDQALGKKSSRDLSLKSFVTSHNNSHNKTPRISTPHINGKDFLLNLDVFERELIAGLSSAAINNSPSAQEKVWVDDVTMTVEATPASRASIPEPTTLMLVSIGILGLFLHRRRTNWGAH